MLFGQQLFLQPSGIQKAAKHSATLGHTTKRQYTNFLSSLTQKTKNSNYFCNPRSMDKFLMVQLC